MRRKYLKIAEISAISGLTGWADQLIASLFLIIILFVMKQLWASTLTSQAVQELGGYSLKELIWYMVGTEILILGLPRLEFTLSEEVRTGDLAMRLKQPFHYLGYHFASSLGDTAIKTVFNLLVAIPTATLFVGPWGGSWLSLPALFLVFLIAYGLNLLLSTLIGLCSFWTEDITGIFFLIDRAKWLLGGMLLPLELYPDSIRPAIERLPFRYMLYEPAQLLVKFRWSILFEVISFQLFWLILFAALVFALYRTGKRRVDVQGG